MKNKKLRLQIKHNFLTPNLEGDLQIAVDTLGPLVNPDSLLFLQTMSMNFPDFLDSIADTYEILDRKIEISSRNLEVSSDELLQLNNQISELYQTLDALINSLNEGFVLFDSKGICRSLFSKPCLDLLGENPAGKDISKVLKLSTSEASLMQDWIDQVFLNRIDFEDLLPLAPQKLENKNNRDIRLTFRPVFNKKEETVYIVLIAVDKTQESESQRKFNEMKDSVERLHKRMKMGFDFEKQIDQANAILTEIVVFTSRRNLDRTTVNRLIHTVKSLFGILSMNQLKEQTHHIESQLSVAPDTEYFEILADYLRDTRSKISIYKEDLKNIFKTERPPEGSHFPESELNKIKTQLLARPQWSATEVWHFLESQFTAFGLADKMRNLTLDLDVMALSLSKKINPIEIEGDFRVSGEDWEQLIVNFRHILSNHVYHGIEPVALRQASGKNEAGTIKVHLNEGPLAYHIVFEDDGGGINTDVLTRKAKASGLWPKDRDLNRQEIFQLIFSDGFSTQDQADANAGRGVGMGAVLAQVKKLRGTVDIHSEVKRYTRFSIQIPK